MPQDPVIGTYLHPPESCNSSGEEDKSLGNVSRGDWIRTSDFRLPKPALYPG